LDLIDIVDVVDDSLDSLATPSARGAEPRDQTHALMN